MAPESRMIRVRVRFYAGLRHRVGVGEVQLELPREATLELLIEELTRRFPKALGRMRALLGYSYWVARNGIQLSPADVLRDGDEIVVFPPISGGGKVPETW